MENTNEDPELYIVEGFAFYTKEEAEKAERELKKIRLLDERLDPDNLPAVRALYIKALDQEVFETEIGLTYLRNLQMHLIGEGYLKSDEKPLIIKYSKTQWEKETERMLEEQKALEKKYKDKADERIGRAKNKAGEAIGKMKNLYLAVGVLVLLIIAMFLLTLTGKNPNIINYRNAVINEYSDWQKDLEQREAELRKKEAELNNE
ncbi:MAG TPA: hypothetical protein DCG85_00355 [Lachnospiraceae bacterium]|nr:hypothetical protein [Lachnospiraceae bacterium]